MTGFDAATSGVAQEHPNEPVDGSLWAQPFCPPKGLAKLGWLKMLKNSTRNWAPNRSAQLKFLATERSTFLNPVSRKILRHRSEGSERRRDEHRIADGIATKGRQGIAGPGHGRAIIQARGGSSAGGVARISRIAAAREEGNSNRG